MGYEGPDLRYLLADRNFFSIRRGIYKMRKNKSQNEIALMRESIKWGHLAHRLMQDLIQIGLGDFEIDAKASLEASSIMKKTLGGDYKAGTSTFLPAYSKMNIQSNIPHGVTNSKKVQEGDIISSYAGAFIEGYNTELERTLCVGKPSESIVTYHEIMLKLQQIALEQIVPRGKCSDPDRAVRRYCEDHDLTKFLLHHSGHGLGLEGHEPPFLDVGDNTPFEEGMVTSVEPGIYVPKLGGFRHSDTVVITKNGCEILNSYPADIESLTVKA